MWPSVSFCSADLLVITSLKPGEGKRRTRWNFPVLKPKSVVGSVHRGWLCSPRLLLLHPSFANRTFGKATSLWKKLVDSVSIMPSKFGSPILRHINIVYLLLQCTKENTVLKALPEMLYLTQVKRKLHPFSGRQLSGTVTKYLKELNLKAEGLVWDFRFWGLGVWLALSLWGLILENHGLCWGRLLTSW